MVRASAYETSVRVAEAIRRGRPLRVLGADAGIRGLCLARAALERTNDPQPLVYVAKDDAAARRAAEDAAFFMGVSRERTHGGEEPILVVPEPEASPFADVSPDPRQVGARLAALGRLSGRDPPRIVVLGLRALVRKVIPRAAFMRVCQTWATGDEIERRSMLEQLERAGYQRAELVEDPGTYAVRGAVVDLYVPQMRFGVRIEWFGDEIERIRTFDPESQRTLRTIDRVVVHPVRETIVTTTKPLRTQVLELADVVNAPSSRSRQIIENLDRGVDFFGIEALTPIFHDAMEPVWSFLPGSSAWIVEDPVALRELARRIALEVEHDHERFTGDHQIAAPVARFFVSADELAQPLENAAVIMTQLEEAGEGGRQRTTIFVDAQPNARLRADLEAARRRKGGEVLRPVIEHVRRLMTHEVLPWAVVVVAPNTTHAQRLSNLLKGHSLDPMPPLASEELCLADYPVPPQRAEIRVVAGDLGSGFESAGDRILILAESDIFGRLTRRVQRRRSRAGIGQLTQLSPGDYVVHIVHGIGRYLGLEKLALKGLAEDFVQLEYAGDDKLYLPVYRLGEIERYMAADAKPPRLDRMGGSTFAAKTSRIKAEVRQIAEELLQLYAQRELQQGHAFPDGGELYAEFESTFPFEETPDQQVAIDAVQRDLDEQTPMDRLICGDVGFGKTEVALRAAFRVALAGKQVAVLAPTTILVQQHYRTFSERMGTFGVRVAQLGRLVDARRRRETVAQLKAGAIDVVVGTHRLLGRDVRFRNLGLVIIDEEQRFGVAQKERFKRLKTHVDVLTLTATPIPRTLHMSLLGIREISLITTPPVDRLAVRTFLTRPADPVLDEGIRRELARGGQIFYVVPRIEGIEAHAVRLRELVPQARVIVAHGKMPPEILERTMIDFIEHRADILVSTTIIESGLDIPRANTMFISRADMFGLAQLYQLRGRIGRSKHRAYCYLMVPSLERLPPDARQRLEAIQRYSELGSGFHVASQDLEIRGAGEILGSRQSGQIQAVGFEAYSRILGEAVAELKGHQIVRESDPDIAFDVSSFLPDDYIEDVGMRLELYRRLAAAPTADDVDAIVDEIGDRFGDPPPEGQHLGHVMACKTYGRQLRALALELRGDRFVVRLGDGTPLEPRLALRLAERTAGRMKLVTNDRIVVLLGAGRESIQRLRACRLALSELVALARP